MKQWWFQCAICKLFMKLIIFRLLFIYFNYTINQSIVIHCPFPIPSPWAARRHHWTPNAPWQCHALEDLLFIYLARGRCTLNVPLLVIYLFIHFLCGALSVHKAYGDRLQTMVVFLRFETNDNYAVIVVIFKVSFLLLFYLKSPKVRAFSSL